MQSNLLLPTDLMCGYYDSRKFSALKTSEKYISTMFEIEYFLEDGGNMYSDGVAYPIRRNFVLICSPGSERYSELPFQTKYLKFKAEGALAEILTHAPCYFHVSQSLEASAMMDELITIHSVAKEDPLLLHGKLLTYLSFLLKNANLSKQRASYPTEAMIQAQEFIKAHYKEPLHLCDIAKSVNLSPNHFHTVFTEAYGLTPRKYLEEHRIKVAKQLLLTTTLTVSEIAEACGFNNQQYLTTVFRSRVDCSPTEFKRRHQSAYFL